MNREITFNVRSKECTQVGSLNTNLLVELPITIVIPEHSVCEMSVPSAEIPLSFYNVSASLQNNVFQYYTNLSALLQNITVPSGNYSVDTLMVVINSAQSHFVMTYNDTFNKFFLTTGVGVTGIVLLVDLTTYWNQIYGIYQAAVVLSPGGYLDGVCNLATVHSLQIRVGLGTGSTISTSNSNSDVIQKIPLQVNANGIIIHNSNNYIQKSYIKSGTIKSFYLNITEQNQKLINLNGCVYELTFLFRIIPDESGISEENKMYRSERLTRRIEPPQVEIPQPQPIEVPTPIEVPPPITLDDIANELLSI